MEFRLSLEKMKNPLPIFQNKNVPPDFYQGGLDLDFSFQFANFASNGYAITKRD
jgi:hypothetical protein